MSFWFEWLNLGGPGHGSEVIVFSLLERPLCILNSIRKVIILALQIFFFMN